MWYDNIKTNITQLNLHFLYTRKHIIPIFFSTITLTIIYVVGQHNL